MWHHTQEGYVERVGEMAEQRAQEGWKLADSMSPQEYEHIHCSMKHCRKLTAERGWTEYAKLRKASERTKAAEEYDELAVKHSAHRVCCEGGGSAVW